MASLTQATDRPMNLANRLLALPDPANFAPGKLRYADHGFTAGDAGMLQERMNDGTLFSDRHGDEEYHLISTHAFQMMAELLGAGCLDFLISELELATADGEDDFASLFESLVVGMGDSAVPGLLQAFGSPEFSEELHIDLIIPLTRLAGEGIEREAIIDAFAEALSGNPGHRSLKGFVVGALGDLGATRCLPAIREAFAANLVDVSIAGDLEEAEIELGEAAERTTPPPRWQEREDELRKQYRLAHLPPLADDASDVEILDHFIRLHRSSRGLRDVIDLDGFLLSVLASPDTIPPSEYLPFVWHHSGAIPSPRWDSMEDAERFLAALMRHHNTVLDGVRGGSHRPPELPGIDEKDAVVSWIHGILAGSSLWAVDVGEDEEGPHHALLSLALHYGKPFADDPGGPLIGIADIVAAAFDCYLERRIEPVVRPRDQPGRNDPCPCGSGKKFKKCCGN